MGNLFSSQASEYNNKKLHHICLIQIFQRLKCEDRTALEFVCKQWKEANELSWYDVKKLELDKLLIPLDENKEDKLKIIMSRCARYLKHLTIINDADQYPWMSDILKEKCPNLCHFEIDMKNKDDKCKISIENLIVIIKSMKKLKYLKITTGQRKGQINNIDNNDFNLILNGLLEDIEEIHLISNNHIYGYAPVMGRFNSLQNLTLNGFILTNTTLEEILKNNNTLVKLDLSRCTFPTNAVRIFFNLIHLEHLNLWLIRNFNIYDVVTIGHYCSRLKHFTIKLEKINQRTNIIIPYYLYRELKYLKLEYFQFAIEIDHENNDKLKRTKNIIINMNNHWGGIKHINIETGNIFSSRNIQEITNFHNLEFLNLQNAEINSQTFINITHCCPQLKELRMDLTNLSENELQALTNFKKIEKLDFLTCKELKDHVLTQIVINCQNLMDLSIWGCSNLTEASLLQVGRLTKLKRLSIRGIKNVPNKIFDKLFELEYLSCFNCPSVSDKGIMKVLSNCLKISHLDVRRTGITVKTINHASQRKLIFKKLDILVDRYVQQANKNHQNLIVKNGL